MMRIQKMLSSISAPVTLSALLTSAATWFYRHEIGQDSFYSFLKYLIAVLWALAILTWLLQSLSESFEKGNDPTLTAARRNYRSIRQIGIGMLIIGLASFVIGTHLAKTSSSETVSVLVFIVPMLIASVGFVMATWTGET